MSAVQVGLMAGLAVSLAFLLPATGHGDFFISNFNSSLILTDHPNLYHAVANEPSGVFPTGLSGAPYGPLFYYPTAAWLQLLDWLQIVDISRWAGTNDDAMRSPGVLLALKLPNLAVYALTAIVIAKVAGASHGARAASLWVANPAVILFTLMMGQNDGWTALASVTALLFALRHIQGTPMRVARYELPGALLAMLFLAVGGAIKLSPVLLIPAFALLLSARPGERLALAAAGLGAFALLIAPFLVNDYFWDYGLLGRQAGKASALPDWSAALLYAGFLIGIWLLSRRRGVDRTTLIVAFVAFHAFFFLIGGWSPQRSVLFIAALAVAVHIQGWLLVPYVLTTAYSLLLALEHRNEIALGLFEPVTSRALLAPPLIDGEVEPLHTIAFAATAIAWAAAIGLLATGRRTRAPSRPWLFACCLALALPVFLAASGAQLRDGIVLEPYPSPAAARDIAPGDEFVFAFISPQSDLQEIAFSLDAGPATASLRGAGGKDETLFLDRSARLREGRNVIALPRQEHAKGRWFSVQIIPEELLRIRMASLPEGLVLASASLNNEPIEGTAAFEARYETTPGLLFADARRHVRRHWSAYAASLLCCAIAAGAVVAGTRRPDAARASG